MYKKFDNIFFFWHKSYKISMMKSYVIRIIIFVHIKYFRITTYIATLHYAYFCQVSLHNLILLSSCKFVIIQTIINVQNIITI